MSFALIFFAMVLKTWRVHKIILGGLKKVKITTFTVGMYNLGCCSVIAFLLVLYSAVGKPHVEYQVVPLISGNSLLKPFCAAVNVNGTNPFDAILFRFVMGIKSHQSMSSNTSSSRILQYSISFNTHSRISRSLLFITSVWKVQLS